MPGLSHGFAPAARRGRLPGSGGTAVDGAAGEAADGYSIQLVSIRVSVAGICLTMPIFSSSGPALA